MYRYIVRGWVLYYNIRQVPTYVCCRCKRRARKYDNGAIYWRDRPVTDVIVAVYSCIINIDVHVGILQYN